MVEKKITVIILNYNGKDDLGDCLRSVLASDDPFFDVLVVDNGSTDESVPFITSHFPDVRILQEKTNRGFAEGNNDGFREAFSQGAEFAALLNNDTRVSKDWLGGLRKGMLAHPLVGICGSLIVDWDGKNVEFDGSVFHPNNASGGYVDKEYSDDQKSSGLRESAYACGGAMMVRRECYEEIGGFDRSFFFYNEDVDLSLRAWIYGFRVLVNPSSIIYHRGGQSVRRYKNKGFRDYYGMRNALTTAVKNYELCTLRCVYRDVLKIYVLSGMSNRLRGFIYNFFILPRTLKKRRVIQRKRLRSDDDIFTRTASGNRELYRNRIRRCDDRSVSPLS